MKKYSMPPEWAEHRAVWMAFPHLEDEWSGALPGAQIEIAALIRAIATEGGETVELLVRDEAVEARALGLLGDVPNVRFHRAVYGDAWTRDTSSIVLRGPEGDRRGARFVFNGWGEKFAMPGDREVGDFLATAMGFPVTRHEVVLEGGAIDVDEHGTLLTTESCLFEANRNPAMDRAAYEAFLKEALGIANVVWLRRGLLNDHTDGHVDTIARFVPGGRAVCMEARRGNDPNREVMEEIASDLRAARDARGEPIDVVRLPSPGVLRDENGDVMPATYCNFYIANRAVIVPTYGVPEDEEAVRILASLFPGRQTLGLSSIAILRGGGSFHCITQQEPA
jgi:agmatine deiminase